MHAVIMKQLTLMQPLPRIHTQVPYLNKITHGHVSREVFYWESILYARGTRPLHLKRGVSSGHALEQLSHSAFVLYPII